MTLPSRVLVTDFDGTMTAHDFYLLAVERLLTPDDLSPWKDFRAGRITHFEAIRRIFSRIHAPLDAALRLVDDMRPDPLLAQSVAALQNAGWTIVVASAGCAWYVDKILGGLGISVEVHANPGYYQAPDGPLVMEAPVGSPFYSPELGVDKAGITRFFLAQGATVAYAGDGVTDAPAALLVPESLRYARADLAQTLREKGAGFQPFERWSEVADSLLLKG
jgi:2-hydroxy-3-keto-5-methylthiopentenyl-1-phosphate phosphatase